MMMISFISILLLTWSSQAWADDLKSSPYCFQGCQLALSSTQFNDTGSGTSNFITSCQSHLKTVSVYLCTAVYCVPGSQEAELSAANNTCRVYANVSLPPFNIIANYDIDRVRRLEPDETVDVLDEVVVPSSALFLRGFNTLDYASYENLTHTRYGAAMYYFWAVVIGVGMATRMISLILGLRRKEWLPIPDDEQPTVQKEPTLINRSYIWMKRFITVPATFGYRCSQSVRWCTIPTRIQSLTILTFIIINVVLCSVNYRVFAGMMYWPKISTQLWRYISDRTGIIAFANFPIVWLFGTRNNVLMWLTGWGFGTYNSFHRWVARVATVEAVVHSIGYTVLVLDDGGWQYFKAYWKMRYWWTGEIATILMCMISVFSVYGLRRSYYEVFLYLHIWISAIVLIAMFYHVEIFNGEYNSFIWGCLVVWVFDRCLRGLRIILFDRKFWNTKATSIYEHDSNLVRLVIPNSNSYLKPQPGIYYYIYVLSDFRIWENHPFTLAYSTQSSHTANTNSRSLGSSGGHGIGRHHENSSEFENLLTPTQSKFSSMTFLIRPYDGFTSRLRSTSSSGTRDLRVLVEGPYGETLPLHKFENVLFVVGGTGIVTPLSYLDKLLSDESRTTSIHILWAVRELAFLEQVIHFDIASRNLIESSCSKERLLISAFVTQEHDPNKQNIDLPPWVNIHLGRRPDVHNEVETSVNQAGNTSLAVMSCGPAQMADDTRKASVDMLSKGFGGVEYFEESFKW